MNVLIILFHQKILLQLHESLCRNINLINIDSQWRISSIEKPPWLVLESGNTLFDLSMFWRTDVLGLYSVMSFFICLYKIEAFCWRKIYGFCPNIHISRKKNTFYKSTWNKNYLIYTPKLRAVTLSCCFPHL